MAERTVTARLRLVYNEFTKGTDAAAKGLKNVGDEAGRTAKRTSDGWQSLGQSMSDLGESMTRRITLPLVGLGVVATKAAGDFDKAFVQMTTLAGVSADEVDGLKESVLDLAGETGKAPQELAEAMFFLQSSGLDAAQAMEALDASAKASAVGLGSTVTLADAASSVMLAYAESGMTAAKALDTLLATAKAGKADPEAIAGQLSKLIPVASALGITFEDVGASLAALSTKGFSAEQGATGLAGVMAKIQKPSQQAQEALDKVGLSGTRLKDLFTEKGLLGALNTLKERLGDSGFDRFLEDQEAIRAGTALTTGDLGQLEDIFADVADSAGDTEKAFSTWAESMGAENARAFADFQVALIRFGDAIAPIAADVLSFLGSMAEGFAKLPEPVQKLVVALAAVVAVAGPLTTTAGKLMSAWGTVTKVFDNWASAGGRAFADAMNNTAASTVRTNTSLLTMGRTLAVGGVLLTGMALLGSALEEALADAPADIAKMQQGLLDFSETTKISGELARIAGDDLSDLATAFGEVFDPALSERATHVFEDVTSLKGILPGTRRLEERKQVIQDIDAALAALAQRDPEMAADVFEAMVDQLAELDVSREDVVKGFDDYASVLADVDVANRVAADGAEGTTEALADQEQAVNEAAEAHRNYADTIAAAVDPVFGLLNALRGNAEAQREVTAAQGDLDVAIRDHGTNSKEAAEATTALQDAMLGVGQSALDVTTAAANLNAAVAENPGLVDTALNALTTWREQGIIPTDEQLRFLQEQLKITALEGVALGGVDPEIEVTETGSRTARERFVAVEKAAKDIPNSRNTRVTTSGTSSARNQVQSFLDKLGLIPPSVVVVLDVLTRNLPGVPNVNARPRESGGPVSSGKLYEVGERGKHELLEAEGRTYLIPGSDGRVKSAKDFSQPMVSAASVSGVSSNVYNIDMRNLVTPDSRKFREAVQEAFNVATRKGRGVNAA